MTIDARAYQLERCVPVNIPIAFDGLLSIGVIAGLVPAILIRSALSCQPKRDHRDKPGDDDEAIRSSVSDVCDEEDGRGASMSYREVSEVRDGMRIDWDVPITMEDGLVLRADVFRPVKEGKYPVLLS